MWIGARSVNRCKVRSSAAAAAQMVFRIPSSSAGSCGRANWCWHPPRTSGDLPDRCSAISVDPGRCSRSQDVDQGQIPSGRNRQSRRPRSILQDAPRPIPKPGAFQVASSDKRASQRAAPELVRQKAKAAISELGERYPKISQFEAS